ncbi:hypothetical protein SNE40_022845 [Patella caerulea]|uniref:Hexosyltransferase n=2 Tax=Patella caerulea TaxID=87958 RepID=A0AAN8IVG2_PATCE
MSAAMGRLSVKKFKEFQRFVFGFCLGYFMVQWLSLSILRIHVKNCRNFFHPSPTDAKTETLIHESEDKFLLVAVMTTRKYLETRAEAMYNTWGQQVPGKIVFFVGGTAVYNGTLPVVLLKDIKEDTYPPQKKSFTMLKYVSNHFLNEYEWFMRADDDVFVKTDRLEHFLRSVNSSKLLYMGQPGTGTKEEKGKLGLLNDTPYCLGGPGVFFTGQTLGILMNHFSACLNSTATRHEDTELGRCVQKHAGIACTSSFEFTRLFYQNYGGKNGSFNHKLGLTEERAITLHPIKQHAHMYRLNNHFSFLKLARLNKKVKQLSETVQQFSLIIDKSESRYTRPNKIKSSQIRKRLRELEGWSEVRKGDTPNDWFETEQGDIWDFISQNKHIYSRYNVFINPMDDVSRKGKSVSLKTAKKAVSGDQKYRFKKFAGFTYQRLSYGKRMENIIPVKTSPDSSISVRTIQRFSGVEFTENIDLVDNQDVIRPTIWIIVPLFKRSRMFASFLSSLTRAIEKFQGNICLCVVLYVDDDDEYKNSQRFADVMHNFLDKLKIRLTILNEPFSRSKAINTGIRSLKNDSLLLIMDVDMIFNSRFLNRVILNTKHSYRAYFPIYFSQYSSNIICFPNKTCDLEIVNFDNEHGTWRFFSYGIVSIYKEDAIKLRGFKEEIKGWGKEDVDFYEKCLKSHLHIFRAADPYLIHIYHRRDCDQTLPKDQLTMCVQSRSQLYGYEKDLFKISKELKLVG